jgi:hypothetical protein
VRSPFLPALRQPQSLPKAPRGRQLPEVRRWPLSKLAEFSCSSENIGFAKDSGVPIPKREESTVRGDSPSCKKP